MVLVLFLAHKREVDAASMALRGGLAFVVAESDPFSGRAGELYDHGRVKALQSFIAR